MIHKAIALLLGLSFSFLARAEVISSMVASSGVILANISGYRAQSETITKNFDVRWLSYRTRTLAALGEFQVGLSSQYQATQLMETRAGIQYYPFAYGTNFEDFHENSRLRYSAALKPYLHAKLGYGRYLITVIGDLGSAEVSSNYISVGGGLGTVYQMTDSVGVDLCADGSMALGTSAVAFSGLLIRARLGLQLYL